MFYRVFILFSTIFLLTLSPAMAQEDLFLGEIKNPSKKRNMSGWGLRLEGSFSRLKWGELLDDSNTHAAYELDELDFKVSLSKLLGNFEPLLSFGVNNTEFRTRGMLRSKDGRLSISAGLIFNITSHKNSVVPFIEVGLGYYRGALSNESAAINIINRGLIWNAGGGVKFFLTKKRNFAILWSVDYVDANSTLEILPPSPPGDTSSKEGFINTSGIGSSLGFIVYL